MEEKKRIDFLKAAFLSMGQPSIILSDMALAKIADALIDGSYLKMTPEDFKTWLNKV